MAIDVTKRFSNRVENYIRYRPGYPAIILEFLKKEIGLTEQTTIADIGSGTGILSELFLKNSNTVYGVEPNKAMREAAERLLKNYPNFKSIDATAEATTLQTASIDLILAGQAFHWFDVQKSKTEFRRILKPNGNVVLIWNDRKVDATLFLQAYDELLYRLGTDYEKVNHKNIDEKILSEFFSGGFRMNVFENYQIFDFEGLKGRVNSSSYVPIEGEPGHDKLMQELQKIFDTYQSEDKVKFEYETKVFVGRV